MKFGNTLKEKFSAIASNNKKKALKFVLGVPTWVILVALFLIVFGFCRNAAIFNRADNDMSKYWAQGSSSSYRHMVVFARGNRTNGETTPSLYIDEDVSLKKADIVSIRTQLQGIVDSGRGDKKNGGLDENGAPKYWEDCYSCDLVGEVSTVTDSSNAIALTSATDIVAVGGNFKVFHPFIYLSGGFLSENCVDNYQIVINDELAWKFFKSYDVVGNKISLMGETFTIAGVVREGASSIDRTANVKTPRCYIYFNALEAIYGNTSEDYAPGSLAITCYEAMLPELVSGVAITDIKNALPTYTETNPQLYVVSYTGRLNILNIWNYMMPIGVTAEKLSSYDFPYWEQVQSLKIQNVFMNTIFIVLGFILLFIGIVMVVLKVRKSIIEERS